MQGIEHPNRMYLQNQESRNALQSARMGVRLVDLDREPLPFPDNSFQVITFSEVMEHLPTEIIEPVFREMYRVLAVRSVYGC